MEEKKIKKEEDEKVRKQLEEKKEQVTGDGFPLDVDLKRFLGCGG